jgi:hypothetical protein
VTTLPKQLESDASTDYQLLSTIRHPYNNVLSIIIQAITQFHAYHAKHAARLLEGAAAAHEADEDDSCTTDDEDITSDVKSSQASSTIAGPH